MNEAIAAITLGLFCVIAILACSAAYRNGVTDGYGYAREPSNPGYRRAGRYLRKRMAYRWPELRATEKGSPSGSATKRI